MNNYLLYSYKREIKEIDVTKKSFFIYFFFLPFFFFSQNSINNTNSHEIIDNQIITTGDVVIVGQNNIKSEISKTVEINENNKKETIGKDKVYVKKIKVINEKEDDTEKIKNVTKNQKITCNFNTKENDNAYHENYKKFLKLFILPNHFNKLATKSYPLKINNELFSLKKENNSLFIVHFELQNNIKCDSIRPPPFLFI